MTQEEALRRIQQAAAEGWKQLDLAGLGLTQLAREIGNCTQLETLVLGKWDEESEEWVGHELTEFPDVIAQLTNLKALSLANNQISAIPDAIAQLSQLTRLYLSGNQISAIPDAIAQLSQLTELDLSDNQITAIPDAIAQLSQLTRLYLWNNQISAIPDAIAQLSQLTRLYLSRNQITTIPDAIRQLEKLEKLDLRGNPIPIPPEILQGEQSWQPGDLRTILDFYFQTRDPNATEPLYEAKLLIVGEGEAGKTSLAQKLLNPDYELKPQQPTTEGIDVLRWEFPHADSQFRVHLWDFGGQEIYHATHQFFLTERSLYILLVDDRRENPNLCYWLSIVELLSQKSPILLVQNEKEDRHCEINVSQLRRDFDTLEKHYTTNLATCRGLESLQRAICQRIAILDHIGTPIPKPWVNVRHILENYSQRQTHIDVSQFFDICVSQGFHKSDKPPMLSLSKYLHDLGIILHFQKNLDGKKSILSNWVILRPEWATNAVYKVVENDEVKANGGYFTQDNLSEIWRDDEYDGLHDELLELMQNFKLCYPIPNTAGRYIAPSRLPIEPPSYPWDDTDNLMVRYEYDFMPKGIITRLIVEMHGLIYRPHPPTPSPNLGEGEPEIFETPLGNFTIDRPHPPTPSANLGESEPEDSKSPLSETWERRLGGEGKSDLVWRDGVLLTNGYAIAEVIENYHQREIRIRIVGREKARLLEPIRHELWKIHSSYDNRLKFQEFIPCNCVQCKGNPDPHFYTFENLRRRLDNFRYEVECEKSYVMVNVRGLMDDFPDYSRPGERERFSGKAYDDRMDDSRSQNSSYHFYFEGNKMTQDSPKTNNFNAPMSGVIGSDNAQVSNNQFIQTNNANTA